MALEYYKFIKISKHGQEYYYNCPNFFNKSNDCFNHFRGDLNRVLLNTLPSQYTTIDCDSVTTSTSTTIPISTTSSTTIGTTTVYTSTTTQMSTSTTSKPCDIGFSSVNFVNNQIFPYDYNLQQGYIQIKLTNSAYLRNYQFKVLSGTNIIKDWTSPVQQTTAVFKLNCANYTIYVRDYNDTGCMAQILNVSIPCLTTTTTSTTTISSSTTSTTTIPINTTSTTTQFQYAPCAIYYNTSDTIYYKDIVKNIDKLLVSDTGNLLSNMSIFNGNLYIVAYNAFGNYIRRINLVTFIKTDIIVKNIPNSNDNPALFNINNITSDSNGNLYMSNGDIYKLNIIGDTITYNSQVVNLYKYYTPRLLGDIMFIANLNAFAMICSIVGKSDTVLLIVKADGSNLILKELFLGNDIDIRPLFVINNMIYCTEYSQQQNYSLKIDLDNDLITHDTSVKFSTSSILGGTQNPNCNTLTYNDQFKFGTMVYNCVDNGIFNLKFDILNGAGQYEYSIDGIGYSPVNSNKFDFNFNVTVEIIYIRDIVRNKIYKFRRDSTIKCDSGFTTTTTSTTTVSCVAITGLKLNGSAFVASNSQVNYSVGTYNGSPITSYLWQVDGGSVADSIVDTNSVNIIWDGNVTNGTVSVVVTNCAGSKSYFKSINIQ